MLSQRWHKKNIQFQIIKKNQNTVIYIHLRSILDSKYLTNKA